MTPLYLLSLMVTMVGADFTRLNQLLGDIRGIQIPLPPNGFRVGDGAVSVTLRTAVCSRFGIDDISLSSSLVNDQTDVNLDILGLDFRCVFDYSYSFLFTRSGKATLDSIGNNAGLQLEIDRPSNLFEREKSSSTSMSIAACTVDVQMTNLDVDGSISAVVFETVIKLLRSGVERATGEFLCRQLRSLANNEIADGLRKVDSALEQYYPPQFHSEEASMLSAEREFSVGGPEGPVQLLNFSLGVDNPALSMRQGFEKLVNMAHEFLVRPTEYQKFDGTQDVDLNVNVLLRQYILEKNGNFFMDFDTPRSIYDHQDRLTRTSVALNSVSVVGLDQIRSLDPLKIVGDQTIQTAIAIDDIHIELDLSIDVYPSVLPDSYVVNPTMDNVVQERITVTFGVENFRAKTSLFLGLNQTSLGLLRLGSLLHTESIVTCFLSTLVTAQIGGLTVEASEIRQPTLSGFVSPGVDRLITNLVQANFHVYLGVLQEAMSGLFHLIVRPLVNKKLSYQYIPRLDQSCPWGLNNQNTSAFVDFRDLLLPPQQAVETGATGMEPYGDLTHRAYAKVLENFIEQDAGGEPKVNSMIRSLIEARSQGVTEEKKGDLLLGTVAAVETPVAIAGLQATASFVVDQVSISNLDSFRYPLKLFEPVMDRPNILNNTMVLGEGGKRIGVQGSVKIALYDGKGVNFENALTVRLELRSLHVIFVLLVRILQVPLLSAHLRDASRIDCWIATMLPPPGDSNPIGIELVKREAVVDDLLLNVSCFSCSSPDLEDFIYQLYSPDVSGNVTGSLQNLLGLILESNYAVNLNEGVYSMAERRCPSSNKFDPTASYRDLFSNGGVGSPLVRVDRDKFAHAFNVANAIIAVLVLGFYFVSKWIIRRRFDFWKKSANPSTLHVLNVEQIRRRREIRETNERSSSMFKAPCLPKRVRYGFPFVLVVTIGIQIAGHLAVLSTVDLIGQVAGEPFTVRSFLEFSFFKGLLRTAGNGGREMAVLAFVFTGIWPYVKLLASLVVWFLPPCKLTVEKRERLLLWFDVFAKLSIVDVLTLLIAVGCLMVYIGGLDESLSDESTFEMKAIIRPGWGSYCIVMSQRILRVSSRYILDCHNKMVNHNSRSTMEDQSGQTLATETTDCELDHNPRHSLSDRQNARGYSPLAIFALVAVVIIGFIGLCLAPAMSIDTRSIWGIVGSGRTLEQAVKTLPLFRVITEILSQSRVILSKVADYIGLGFLMALFFIASAVVPVMRLISLIRKMFQSRHNATDRSTSLRQLLVRSASLGLEQLKSSIIHLTSSQSSSITKAKFLALYRLEAYRQLGVFVAAFIVSCWQLGAVTAYTIHMYCYVLETLFRSVERLGLVESTSAQCYQAQASDPSTLAILFLGFLLLFTSFILSAFSHYKEILRRFSSSSTFPTDVATQVDPEDE